MKYIVDVNGVRATVALDRHGLTIDGTQLAAHLAEHAATPLCTLTIGDAVYPVRVRRQGGRGRYTLWIGGFRYEVEALDERQRTIRDLDASRNVQSGPAPLLAPMPGLIVRVLASEGDIVQAGQGLIVVEAMKMENELRAVVTARVAAVLVTPGVAVEKGTLLVELEPLG